MRARTIADLEPRYPPKLAADFTGEHPVAKGRAKV
jgi:hypothetical protein